MNIKKTAVITAIAGVVLGASFAAAQVTTTSSCYQFNTNLRVGNTGADVKALQQTLNARGFTVAAAGHAGSAGMETSYFGNATKNALIKWQDANASSVLTPWGLASGTGFFGATSRAEMNKCAVGTVPTDPTNPTNPVSGSVAVSLAQIQPNNVLVEKSSHAKLADFVFSGTGIVTNVKLQRTGVSNNNALVNVYLYEGNTRISDAASVLADGSINFNYGTGLFSVTGSKTISVYADIAATTSGQSIGVALTGYTVSGSAAAVVSGLNGPALPVGSATIVGAEVTKTPSQSTADVGNQNVNVWSGTIDIKNHDAYLAGANFKMIGSAPTTALSNVKLYIDGVQVGNATAVDAMGRISISGNTFLRAGLHNINLRGDIADGAGRSFYIVLEQGSDLLVQDAQLAGVYSMPTLVGGNQIFNLAGDTLSINSCSSGCVILSADTSFSSAKATVGGSNQTIGKFTLSSLGEPVKLISAKLDIKGSVTATASSSESVSNITVYVNGMAVTSGISNTLATDPVNLTNLGGFIVNPGTPATIEVKADLKSTAGTNISAQTLTAYLSEFTVQGQQSRNTATTSQSSNSVSVGGLSADFSKNSAFSGSSIPTSQQGVKIGSYILSTGASEGVTLTQIDLGVSAASSMNLAYVTNLILKDGAGNVLGQRSSIGSGSAANLSFSLYQAIAANSSKTFEFFADFSNATGTLTTVATGTYQGAIGMTTATKAADAATTTVAVSGIATPTIEASASKGTQYVTAGSVSPVVTFRVKAIGSEVRANTIELIVSNPSVVSALTVDGNQAVSNGNGRYTATVNKTLNTLAGTAFAVGVTFNQADSNNELSSATTTVGIAYIGTDTNGVVLGEQGTTTVAATSSTWTLTGAMPTAVKGSGVYVGANVSGEVKVGTLTVSTSNNGPINVNQLSVSVGTPSGTATATKLKVGGTDVATCTTGTCAITGGYIIGAAQTVTFDVYATVAIGTTGGNTTVNPGAEADFVWSDFLKSGFTGTLVENYGN